MTPSERLRILFSELVSFRQEFLQLDKEAENLNEIAMNAAVTAAQTGKSIRVYTEISNQIAQSAKKMTVMIEKNRQEANHILNEILKATSTNNLNKHFIHSQKNITNEHNKRYLAKKVALNDKEWKQYIKKINRHIYPEKTYLKSILQIQYKLFGIHNCLIIESSNLDNIQSNSIENLSKNLSQSYETSIACIQNLTRILKVITKLISNLSH